jgi:hypothetical protein
MELAALLGAIESWGAGGCQMLNYEIMRHKFFAFFVSMKYRAVIF